eukprot:scaffold95012_cov59-Cyclotella_meneghiniana.AAC.3
MCGLSIGRPGYARPDGLVSFVGGVFDLAVGGAKDGGTVAIVEYQRIITPRATNNSPVQVLPESYTILPLPCRLPDFKSPVYVPLSPKSWSAGWAFVALGVLVLAGCTYRPFVFSVLAFGVGLLRHKNA